MERKNGVRTIIDAIVAEWWGIFLFLFGGATAAIGTAKTLRSSSKTRYLALKKRDAEIEAKQTAFESRLDDAFKASTARHLDDVAACNRCRADVLDRIMRADAWAHEDSQHQWATTNNLISKMEIIAQGVARIEGLLEAQRLAERKQG